MGLAGKLFMMTMSVITKRTQTICDFFCCYCPKPLQSNFVILTISDRRCEIRIKQAEKAKHKQKNSTSKKILKRLRRRKKYTHKQFTISIFQSTLKRNNSVLFLMQTIWLICACFGELSILERFWNRL